MLNSPKTKLSGLYYAKFIQGGNFLKFMAHKSAAINIEGTSS